MRIRAADLVAERPALDGSEPQSPTVSLENPSETAGPAAHPAAWVPRGST
jgi:hypothetical protein